MTSIALTMQAEEVRDEPLQLEQCPWLNISVCPATVTASVKQQPFQVVVYNPLAWKRSTPIRVPVAVKLHSAAANGAWVVKGEHLPCFACTIVIGVYLIVRDVAGEACSSSKAHQCFAPAWPDGKPCAAASRPGLVVSKKGGAHRAGVTP